MSIFTWWRGSVARSFHLGRHSRVLFPIMQDGHFVCSSNVLDRRSSSPVEWVIVSHHHHHASLLKSSIKQVACFGAWALCAYLSISPSLPLVWCSVLESSYSMPLRLAVTVANSCMLLLKNERSEMGEKIRRLDWALLLALSAHHLRENPLGYQLGPTREEV